MFVNVSLTLCKTCAKYGHPAYAVHKESASACTAVGIQSLACVTVWQLFPLLRTLLQKLHAIHLQEVWRAVQDASGTAAREVLTRVLQRWGEQLSSSKGRADLHNPLSLGEALPLLPLSRSLFAGAQWHLLLACLQTLS